MTNMFCYGIKDDALIHTRVYEFIRNWLRVYIDYYSLTADEIADQLITNTHAGCIIDKLQYIRGEKNNKQWTQSKKIISITKGPVS